MALVSGMAVSDGTKTKHDHFEHIFRTHAVITRGIIRKHMSWCYPRYLYIDMNAGAGNVRYPDGTTGATSALIASRVLRQLGHFTYRAYLIDKEPANCEALEGISFIQEDFDIQVLCEDNREALNRLTLASNAFGLLFNDPNTLIPDLDLLEALACRPEYDRVDFLIYMSAANYKRDRRANGREYLLDRLARIKPHWCVQQPHDKHQKTFLLGSKWNGFGKWKHDLAFEPVTTERGRAYLNLINLTADERDQAQQPPLVA